MNGMNARRSPGDGPLRTALLFGSLWGLAEATLGHLLHAVRVPGLPGLVMAPLAVWIMGRAAARSASAAAVFAAGVVAAGFKFLDLFVPGTDILALSNPVRAILLEALAGALWIGLLARTRGTVPLRGQSPHLLGEETSPFSSRVTGR